MRIMKMQAHLYGAALVLLFLLQGCATAANGPGATARNPYDKPGFTTISKDGRLWVFRADSAELAAFQEKGKPAKHVVRPKAGPDGLTLLSPDGDIITEYLVAKPGFATILKDGRLWVFRADSAELAAFREKGKPAKHVVRPKAGPLGLTLLSPDAAILDEYLAQP